MGIKTIKKKLASRLLLRLCSMQATGRIIFAVATLGISEILNPDVVCHIQPLYFHTQVVLASSWCASWKSEVAPSWAGTMAQWPGPSIPLDWINSLNIGCCLTFFWEFGCLSWGKYRYVLVVWRGQWKHHALKIQLNFMCVLCSLLSLGAMVWPALLRRTWPWYTTNRMFSCSLSVPTHPHHGYLLGGTAQVMSNWEWLMCFEDSISLSMLSTWVCQELLLVATPAGHTFRRKLW